MTIGLFVWLCFEAQKDVFDLRSFNSKTSLHKTLSSFKLSTASISTAPSKQISLLLFVSNYCVKIISLFCFSLAGCTYAGEIQIAQRLSSFQRFAGDLVFIGIEKNDGFSAIFLLNGYHLNGI